MASSFNNRHWPSMFRSKHAAEPWQAHPDVSSSPPPHLLSGAAGNNTAATGSCLKHTSSGYAGGEERSADPKPRWNPRPEQIRILEAIFNSGMVNPPRDEIPRIRMRLQEYGHVGDANVFYWFQNRKSRSKNKLRSSASYAAARPCPTRARASSTAAPPPVPPPPPQQQQQFQLLAAASPVQAAAVAPTSSSSSSSDRSSGSSEPAAKRAAAQAMSSPTAAAMDLLGPLAAACPTQMYYHQGHQPMAPPPAHKVQQDLVVSSEIFQQWPQGYCVSAGEVAAILGGGHGQYMHQHVPVVQQQQPPALPTAGAPFLGLCNEGKEPAIITGARRGSVSTVPAGAAAAIIFRSARTRRRRTPWRGGRRRTRTPRSWGCCSIASATARPWTRHPLLLVLRLLLRRRRPPLSPWQAWPRLPRLLLMVSSPTMICCNCKDSPRRTGPSASPPPPAPHLSLRRPRHRRRRQEASRRCASRTA
ncbi:hypothetical protein HU200_036831 [Digitaria exilis]|uniref:Homeobox domain-containing protein n=1 Tax=Digitaria exilis TaxID=1010633 RepID=A0A835BFP8_9POAL|nr:hypothetical protein HU200_036831 [Digitaria exilis]